MNPSKFIVMLLALVVIGVAVAGCLGDSQPGSDNLAGSTVTIGNSPAIIATFTGQPITPIPTKTQQLADSTAVLLTVSPTAQVSSMPTSTPLPSIVWAEDVEQAAIMHGVDSGSIVWSPVTNEFIIHDCWSALIVQLPGGGRTPITWSSGERLSFPQWSSDGQYLSMTVHDESEGEVVILRVP